MGRSTMHISANKPQAIWELKRRFRVAVALSESYSAPIESMIDCS